MNDNRSRDIFYGVVAVATLIVALVGATLAYFSISSSSNEGAVSAVAATVSIDYSDGQNVIAQASELIPATLQVVKNAYMASANGVGSSVNYDYTHPVEEGETRNNRCIDDNDKEVCSIYRFTVSSDMQRNITAKLNTESNGFTYLAYAVRDVTAGTWIQLDSGEESIGLNKCDESDDETTACYTVVGSNKVYNQSLNASTSIFGYNGLDLAMKTVAATPQTYDLVIFLKENNDNQNIDQGKRYRGTIVVDVVDANGSAGQVTGQKSAP